MPYGRAIRALALSVALIAGCDPAAEPTPEALEMSIDAIDAAAPARAAIRTFVPMLGGDPAFEALVAESLVEAHRNKLGKRAAETSAELREIRASISRAGEPDVFVGIPYVESRLSSKVVSPQCAGGYWQFLPEVAVSEGLRVRSCTLKGRSDDTGEPYVFSPGRTLPPRSERVYLGSGSCRIASCAIDDRRDLGRSTDAAMRHLARIGEDKALADHPHRVPLQILAFNAGLGGTQRVLEATDGAPFDVIPSCATGDCLVLARESALYVPRVVAAAAIVACNGAGADAPELSDWARSDMCGALHEAGMAPEPLSAAQALASAAGAHREGWAVGLATMTVAGFGMDGDRAAADAALAQALAGIEGIRMLPGVPGEQADALVEQGAQIVITGEMGRRSGHTWLRLERWEPVEGVPQATGGAFVLLDGRLGSREALEVVADALLRPVRDRQSEAIADLVEAQRDALGSCLPADSPFEEAFASVSLRVDADGRASALAMGPQELTDEVIGCLEARFAGLVFPRELAGAGTTLELGVEAPAIADAAE